MTDDTLKPCPFCGNRHPMIEGEVMGDDVIVYVRCQACGGSGAPSHVRLLNGIEQFELDLQECKKYAMEDWNARQEVQQ